VFGPQEEPTYFIIRGKGRKREKMLGDHQTYTVWIEAEYWIPGEWKPDDDNTDVIVIWDNGSRWFASFISYQNVATLTEKNKKTGENISGTYFWVSHMILIDVVSRPRIKEVIRDFIHNGSFESAFTLLPSQGDDEAGEHQ
jgi:hypothetical protein